MGLKEISIIGFIFIMIGLFVYTIFHHPQADRLFMNSREGRKFTYRVAVGIIYKYDSLLYAIGTAPDSQSAAVARLNMFAWRDSLMVEAGFIQIKDKIDTGEVVHGIY